MFLHFSFYFVTLTLQRPRLQHAGLGDKELPASLPPCSSTSCLLQDPCWHRQVSEFRGLFKTVVFTPCLLGMLCTYTSDYANIVGPQKPSIYQSWSNTYPEEFYRFIGLLMYMNIVHSIWHCVKQINGGKLSFTTFLILHVWIHLSCLKISKRSMQIYQNYEDLTDMDS